MKTKHLYSIDIKGNHLYEYTTNNKTLLKPLIIKIACSLSNINNLEKHTKTSICFKNAINSYKLKQKNVIKIYLRNKQ